MPLRRPPPAPPRAASVPLLCSAAAARSVLLLCLFVRTRGLDCIIQGAQAGVCAAAQDVQDRMPFCAAAVTYDSCIPKSVPWFPNVTLETKDALAQSVFQSFVARRLAIEKGSLKPTDPSASWSAALFCRRAALGGGMRYARGSLSAS